MSTDDVIAAIDSAEVLQFPAKVPRSSGSKNGGGKKPPKPPKEDDGEFVPGDGGGGFGADGIIATLNAEFSLVLYGSRAMIIRNVPNAPIEDRTRVLSVDAFKTYFSNKSSPVRKRSKQPDGTWEDKFVDLKWAPYWLSSPERKTYDGIEFFPDPHNAPGTPGYYNLWRGLSLAPDVSDKAERWKKYKIYKDHLFTNVCNGDEAIFKWVWAWCAHMLQRPRERVGTAIALRGKMGTGKTKFGEVLGSLFESHYFLVDDPRFLTGQFNAHMATCILLQVDEGFWAGDKAAEGRLKGLITAPKQMIEAKGVDPIRLDNYVRLIFTSNEDWVIPAGMDERRFCVLDIAPHCAQNHSYFSEMDAEINNGGREALLADLLDYDLDAEDVPNLRVIPKTGALLEQKLRSFDSITSWWFERLSDGCTTRRRGTWAHVIPVDTIFDDYVHNAEKVGIRRKAEKTSFGMRLRKLIPGLEKRRQIMLIECGDGSTVNRRVCCFVMPKLQDCREAFQASVGQAVDWGAAEDEQEGENDDAPADVSL